MGHIVTLAYYRGIPDELVDVLEAASQTVVATLFEMIRQVYADPTIELWNCSVTRSVVTHEREDAKYSRLLVADNSSGYWIVADFGQPDSSRFPEYAAMWDFWLYGAQDEIRKPSGPIDWASFESDWGLSRCDLFWKARKMTEAAPWGAHVHHLDFKHPLWRKLHDGIQAHKGADAGGAP